MDILLHTCCGPCSIECVSSLREEGYNPIGFWFNPNIHPFTEYRSRLESLKKVAQEMNFNLEVSGEYALREFISAVYLDFDARCNYCYDLRISKSAQYAAEHGFGAFTTSLLISPYQNHEKIVSVAQLASEKYEVEFLYRDFRPKFRSGQLKAREMALYMQKYCGCVFSEEDRYLCKPAKSQNT